jgi:hypothetical protein
MLSESSIWYYKIYETSIDLYSANTGENVTQSIKDDPVKKAMVQVQGVFAELEKSRLVKKLRKARESVRERDGRCEGRKPYGTLDGEQEVFELIKSLHRKPKSKKRMSYQKIADELNSRGIRPRSAHQWEAMTIHNIIKIGNNFILVLQIIF